MVNILEYTLFENHITPDGPQSAGVQGEHRGTALVFKADTTLVQGVQTVLQEGAKAVCKIDLITEAGEKFSGPERPFEKLAEPFYLTAEMTAAGLPAVVVVRIIIRENTGDYYEFYKAQCRLEFQPSAFGAPSLPKKDLYEKFEAQAEEIFRELEERGERICDLLTIKTGAVSGFVETSARHLKEVSQLARQTAKVGEAFAEKNFVFLGGDAKSSANLQFVVDDELSETSKNPLENRAVALALKEALSFATEQTLLLAHPVGSLYFSSSSTDPATLFGGTWERVKDKFILTAGDVYKEGEAGGEANHKLLSSEMPSHTHAVIKAFGSQSIDVAYQPNWALKMTEAGMVNAESNPSVGGVAGIGYTGGNTPHNNMPPYEVYYCWKRTA